MAKRFFDSFIYALRGLRYVFKREQNFRIQICLAIIVVALMFAFPLRAWEIIVLILMIAMVLTMELLNTALEQISDLLKPRLHDYVWVIKDMMAGAVLVSSVCAGITGLIIFLPHFLALVK